MTNAELQELLKLYPDNLEIWIDAQNNEGGIQTDRINLKTDNRYPVLIIFGKAGYCQTYHKKAI